MRGDIPKSKTTESVAEVIIRFAIGFVHLLVDEGVVRVRGGIVGGSAKGASANHGR